MANAKIAGIINSNVYDESLSELTAFRTMGSVPFAGRYRLIDFPLSAMVNAGIDTVGIITNNNYKSLMDHVSSGKPWDLARKKNGMFILPPYATAGSDSDFYYRRIGALNAHMSFIDKMDCDYVFITDCNNITSLDIKDFLAYHQSKDADITIAYKHGIIPNLSSTMAFSMDNECRIRMVSISPEVKNEVDYSMNIIIMKKILLQTLIKDAVSRNKVSFEKDIILENIERLKIFGYEIKGFSETIDSLQKYFDVSMKLLDTNNLDELFSTERPIYTKVRDDVPASYKLSADVKNSVIANGCIIEGTVENSILFRGVRIGKDAVVKNSIVFQDSFISQNASVEYTITDKSVVIRPDKHLSGAEDFPIFIGKEIVV